MEQYMREKFELTSISFAAMSNRWWHLVNFTDFSAQTKTDATADTISR